LSAAPHNDGINLTVRSVTRLAARTATHSSQGCGQGARPSQPAGYAGRWADMTTTRTLLLIAFVVLGTTNGLALQDSDCKAELSVSELAHAAQAFALGQVEQFEGGAVLCDGTLSSRDLPDVGACYAGTWYRVAFRVKRAIKGSVAGLIEIHGKGRILDLAHCEDSPDFRVGSPAVAFVMPESNGYILVPGRTGIINVEASNVDDVVGRILSELHDTK